jgi:DNA-binding response OmpR family regulator
MRRAGFQVIQAFDGEAALQRWAEEQPDLIILDVNLPKLDGFAVCRRIREQADTPILLLTVRDEEDDIVHGLELGADDYITKPFSPRQLVARAQAVLRRVGKIPAPAVRQVGELTLDPSRREMHIGRGEMISLTPLESRLLDHLMLNAGHVLTADAIIEHVWGPEGGDRDMLRQLVHRLRGKIAQACRLGWASEPDLTQPDYIETVPGLGYGLSVPPSTD